MAGPRVDGTSPGGPGEGARALGLDRSILHATDAGRPVYAAMGFEDPELDMRTRTFVVYHSMEAGFYAKLSKDERRRAIAARHALFTNRRGAIQLF